MTTSEATTLLQAFREGAVSLPRVIRAFQAAPVADLDFAQVDLHRALRVGFPEVIFGTGKTAAQIVAIGRAVLQGEERLLVTRVDAAKGRILKRSFRNGVYYPVARCFVVEKTTALKRPGTIAILSAGTSDLPVAEEAAVTAEVMGNKIERIYDVGVAGLHRLFGKLDRLQQANVLIVVAGMEGALPSVVAGLVSRPVIAVPTSVGYGAAFQGMAALLGMLTSCGSGVTVVNIDNGFGAAYAASQINSLAAGHGE